MTLDQVFWLLCGVAVLFFLLWAATWDLRRTDQRQAARHRTGQVGEHQVHTLLVQHYPPSWVLRDVTLPDPQGGTVQIDHILVCPAGVLVLETKHWSGKIDASYRAAHWVQWFPNGTVRYYQNPLHQNNLHLRVVRYYLAPLFVHHPIQTIVKGFVVMTGTALPLSQWPPHVGTLAGLRQTLAQRSGFPLLTTADIQHCVACLRHQRFAPTPRTARRHRRYLRRKPRW